MREGVLPPDPADPVLAYLARLPTSGTATAALVALATQLRAAVPEVLTRASRGVHFTASAIVVDPASRRVLLVHHPKFGRWLQLGGHCDGDPDLAAVARREAIEESGIDALVVDPDPVAVDLHPGEPTGGPHLHLDVCFLAAAPPGTSAAAPVSPEGLTLAWFAAGEIRDPEIAGQVGRALGHWDERHNERATKRA